jgi:hypothetical protein
MIEIIAGSHCLQIHHSDLVDPRGMIAQTVSHNNLTRGKDLKKNRFCAILAGWQCMGHRSSILST